MAENFESSRALRSPPHITLFAPFFLAQKKEKELAASIAKSVEGIRSFSLMLNGFEAFKPRVIFIANEESMPLEKLQEQIFQGVYVFLQEQRAEKQVKKMSFNPHMTIAYRDLTKENFLAAWPEFEKRPFKASFRVDHVCLLKHNRRTWDILERIPLQTH
jgi:2'-5' RNA ligase